MFTKKSAISCFVALTFSLTFFAAGSTKGPKPFSGSGAKKGSLLDSKKVPKALTPKSAPKGWKENLRAILVDTDKWYRGRAFDPMQKFKKAGPRKNLADLIEGEYLTKFGDSLLAGRYSEAFGHLFDFIQYTKKIDPFVAVHIDAALAKQLDYCVTKAAVAQKKPCVQVLLNPGIVTAELLNWDSFFQKKVEQYRGSVLDAVASYPADMGLFCQNYFNDTVEHYGSAKKTYKQTARATVGSSGSKSRPVTLRAMTAITLSLAYPQRLGNKNCPCSQMASMGFVCGACGMDPLAMEDFMPGLLGAGDRLPSSSSGGGGGGGSASSSGGGSGGATISGGGVGGGAGAGFSGSSKESPLGGLTGNQVNLGCGMNFGGGAGGGASGFAPCRAGTSQFADSVRSQSPGGSLTNCVRQLRTDMMNVGAGNLGVSDPGCNLAADGQGQGTPPSDPQQCTGECAANNEQADNDLTDQPTHDALQAACTFNATGGCTSAQVDAAAQTAQGTTTVVGTQQGAWDAAGISPADQQEAEDLGLPAAGATCYDCGDDGSDIIVLNGESPEGTSAATQYHEELHVALDELGVPNEYHEDIIRDLEEQHYGSSGMPDPSGGGSDNCSAAAQMLSDFLNCTGIGGMSPGAEQAWENSPQGGGLNPWINPAPDSPGMGGGIGMPPMLGSSCGSIMSDSADSPWWVPIAADYGVRPDQAGMVDPCQPGDDACGSAGGGGGPIQQRGGVIDPAGGDDGAPFGPGTTAAPLCSSCPSGAAGAACRALCQDTPTGGGGVGPDPEGGGD